MTVVPLNKITKAGVPYERRPEIQALIVELVDLSPADLVHRCINYNDPVPMETLVYLLRHLKESIETSQFESVFKAFFKRVEVSLKKYFPDASLNMAPDIRQEVMDQLAEMIARDRNNGETTLDYYEVNFNAVFFTLRMDILRKIGPPKEGTSKKEGPSKEADILWEATPLIGDDNGEVLPHVDKRVRDICEPGASKLDDPSFRSRLYVAINDLPDNQRRAVGLLLKGIQVEAKDPNTPSISKILGCTDKTVRNRLHRAYAKLQQILLVEEEL